MRQNALPLLEAWGVDLVMTGHSHSYERSYLLDGHYGISTSLDPVANVLDPGDGSESGDGAYEKPDLVAAQNAGAVYAVAGSSGKVSNAPLDHPAMYISSLSLGSMVLDISANRLDAVFISESASVLDSFSILKTPDTEPPLLTDAVAEDANHVIVHFNEAVDSASAENSANYAIGGLSISDAQLLASDRSIRLTTSTMADGTTYTLTVIDVQDLVGQTIAPNSSRDFNYFNLMALSFQDGTAPNPAYTGTRDAYIRENSPTTAYGQSSNLQVDGDEPSGSGSDMNILLSWDVSAIPAHAIVEAAEFQLEVTNISSGVYSCYGLERHWTEAQVTWNVAATGTSWGTAGAEAASDRNNDVVCNVSAGSTGPLTVTLDAAGIARVQSWVSNPASNHGLIISNSSTTDGADFHSREAASALTRPKLNVIYRFAPESNQVPTADFSPTCSELHCDFADSSTDIDGSILSWDWDFGDGNGSTAQNPSHDFAGPGTYSVSLRVTDDDGDSDSTAVNVTVDMTPAFIDQVAQADVSTNGNNSGGYVLTHNDDSNAQALTERESGGKKNQRYSFLEHTWQFSVVPGSAITLYANTWSGGSSEGDNFQFAWSTDNNNFTNLFTVSSTSPNNLQTANLPASGTIYIRVTDTNQQAGQNNLDTVFVDHLYIRSENGTPPPNQDPVASFNSNCNGLGCNFNSTSSDPDGSIVSWSWTFGDGGTSTAQNPSHTYASAGTYNVTLNVTDNDGATDSTSNPVTVVAGGALNLSANGYKVRGVHTIDLQWSGASGGNVDIERNGNVVTTTANDGSHTDDTGNKGSGTYVYRVCNSGTTSCSNEVTVIF